MALARARHAVMVEKPRLVVVTGMPGAGKTTFAEHLGAAVSLPVLSRDRIKEGYVHTRGLNNANRAATDAFFDALACLIDRGVSVIAEAAFQDHVWRERLAPFDEKARVTVIVCEVSVDTALARFAARGLSQPDRARFHDEADGITLIARYEPPRLDAPTYRVDTSGAYDPPIARLWESISRAT